MGANHARTISRSDAFQLSFIVDADLARATALAEQFGGTPVASIDSLRGAKSGTDSQTD